MTTDSWVETELEQLKAEVVAMFNAGETLRVHLCNELGIPYETATDALILGAVRRAVAKHEDKRP